MTKTEQKQPITFREAYQLPFHNSYGTIFSSNHVMTFNVKSKLSDETIDRLLAILNGTSKEVVTKSNVTHKDGIVYFNENEVFLIRGWGHLTGCGALNLSPEIAASIQYEFAEWVVSKLTGKEGDAA